MADKHFMVDIETMASSSDAVVVSIGSIEFDPFSDYINLDDAFAYNLDIFSQSGRKVSAPTMDWWMKQDRKIWEKCRENPIHVNLVLSNLLKHWNYGNDILVWAKGPDFDCTILIDLCTWAGIKPPLYRRNTRDVRTAIWLGKQRGITFPERLEDAHIALNDAIYQAKVVQACLKGVK